MSNTGHNDPSLPESGLSPAGDLYVAHAKKLRRLVGGQVSTSDANLDDACSFAWTQLVAIRPGRRGSIFAWLATVAIREAWRLHRLERRDGHDGDEVTLDAMESPTAGSASAAGIGADQVMEALRTIHPRKRRMLVLHAAGFTYQEIAKEYGVSVERARALVYTARLQIRDRTEAD
jgi:RNA polymerase sigma factor (sigma-70 family)